MRSAPRNFRANRIQASLVLLVVWGAAASSARAQLLLPADHIRRTEQGRAFNLKQFQVTEGSKDNAIKYYVQDVAPQMKFFDDIPGKILTSNVQDLLKYFGYENVTPSDLHALSSDELIAKSPDGGDILATRFFAPKITLVTEPPNSPPASGFGWRKLVRFKARPGSDAEAQDIGLLMFLQNSFEKTVTNDPFNPDENVAFFNQAMAIRTSGVVDATHRPVYFFTFGTLVKVHPVTNKPVRDAAGKFLNDGPIIFSLAATFDGRDSETGQEAKDYFVPDACFQCHGGRNNPKANLLDTDHWQDRVTPKYGVADPHFDEEDFTALAAAPYGVLYDAGKDDTSAQYKTAFDVIRQLNAEIKTQNEFVGGPFTFQTEAAKKWLALHDPLSHDVKHVPPYERGFGSALWDPTNDKQRRLLYYLNRYCYRCHSSIKYNVFDRASVEFRSSAINPDMQTRVKEFNDPVTWMPQDRPFPGLTAGAPTGDLQEFLDLLDDH